MEGLVNEDYEVCVCVIHCMRCMRGCIRGWDMYLYDYVSCNVGSPRFLSLPSGHCTWEVSLVTLSWGFALGVS